MDKQKNLNTTEENKKKEKSKLKKVIKTVIEWIIYAIIFVIIVWGTPWALTKILKTDYPIASITSSSMWPVLKKGDIVFIKGVLGKEDIKRGDIVVYSNDKGFTIHRVKELYEKTFLTRGDANNVDDLPVEYEKLIGKTVNLGDKPLRIPYLGKLSKMYHK